MHIVRRSFTEKPLLSKALTSYIPDSSFAVLDIETLGLSPAHAPVILVGLITYDPNSDRSLFLQIFADRPEEEEDILHLSLEELGKVDFLVSYNGRFFDIPFLVKRCRTYRLAFPDLFNLDLFPLVKYYSPLNAFTSSFSQTAIEKLAGIADLRKDEISGKESILLYERFLEEGSSWLRNKILLHNADDIRQLFRLLHLTAKCDLHRFFFRTGFPVGESRIRKTTLHASILHIQGKAPSTGPYISFPTVEKPYKIFIEESGTFSVDIPLSRKAACDFVDLVPLLGEKAALLQAFSAYQSGYLILKEGDAIHFDAINHFSSLFVAKILAELKISGKIGTEADKAPIGDHIRPFR